MALDMAGVMVSQGAACSSGTMRASPTLMAMDLEQGARESIRVSLGWTTTEADIDAFLAAWANIGRRRAA
jgi:cysteine desulfurase